MKDPSVPGGDGRDGGRGARFKKKPIPAQRPADHEPDHRPKRRPGKIGFTARSTKLANPETPVYALAARFQEFLHFPNPQPIYALIGGIAGNMLALGKPLWLMLVGPSSSGKTVLIEALRQLPNARSLGDIDTRAAFLSGVKKKERAAEAKGGLLAEIGEKGVMLWPEFTAVLELPRDQLKIVLTALRQIYDGHYERDVGTEGGRKLTWDGNVCAFGGVTNAIDLAHEFSGKMGERFVYYRMPITDGFGESLKGLNTHRMDLEAELAEVVKEFFEGLGLQDWFGTPARELKLGEMTRIIELSQFATRARSAVMRDRNNRDIIGIPQAESPMRTSQQLHRLYLGMELVGVDEEDRWAVLKKVALDSMLLVRKVALDAMLNGKTGVGEIGEYMRVSRTTAERTLQDLEAHGVVEQAGHGSGWEIGEWARKIIT